MQDREGTGSRMLEILLEGVSWEMLRFAARL